MTDVSAVPGAPMAVLAVSSPFVQQGPIGTDLLGLDLTTGTLSAVVQRTDASESLGAPAWWADASGLLFHREDHSVVGIGYLGVLIVRAYPDPSEQVLILTGLFHDIASPRYAPQGDRIAFMAPGTFLGQTSPGLLTSLLGAGIASAHGFPWDLWVVSADGSGVRRLARLGADDAPAAWSPDGAQLFVYGGTGSFLVDASTGEVTPVPYVTGYGSAAWLAT